MLEQLMFHRTSPSTDEKEEEEEEEWSGNKRLLCFRHCSLSVTEVSISVSHLYGGKVFIVAYGL